MKIKKLLFLLALLFLSATGFAENVVLMNKSSYPSKGSKMMVQWASTTKEVQEGNQAITNGSKLNASTMQMLTQAGKVNVNLPKNAEYFRVLVWSKAGDSPDLLTNWVQIVPNKTYQLDSDHLVPAVLMAGTGC